MNVVNFFVIGLLSSILILSSCEQDDVSCEDCVDSEDESEEQSQEENVDEQEVKHYTEVIEAYTTSSENYSFPIENLEFTSIEESDEILEYGTFDFIVIGAGSAGSVVSTRLSEVSEWKTLLLEAGEDTDELSEVPGRYAFLQLTKWNWGYLSTEQRNGCLGMKDKMCNLPRGKALGGSSAINGLVYCRGWKKDFDKWEKYGLQGWNYEEVLPYFRKSENSSLYTGSLYHGNDGPLGVVYSVPDAGLLKVFLDSQSQLSKRYIDYNGEEGIGYSRTQVTTKNGRRENMYGIFVQPIQNRQNLKISRNSFAYKILVDKKRNNTAYGVEFLSNSRRFIARAQKEVILSAGAYNSPQLLMLSGIGPKEDLEKHDIPVIEDLPAVGKNLKDHPFMINLVFRTNHSENCPKLEDAVREFLNGRGKLTSPGGMYGISFTETKKRENGIPDIEYIFLPPACFNTHPPSVFNLNENLSNDFRKRKVETTDFIVYVIVLHPKSTGSITLKSNNPKDFPEIDINQFSDSRDLETMYKGIKEVFRWIKTPAFKSVNARLMTGIGDCNHYKKHSRDYWYCRIRHEAAVLYHPIGTTRMASSKKQGVVDNRLKAFGINNFRVVDAGAIPSTVSGHTNAATLMIAERASDFIKCEHDKC